MFSGDASSWLLMAGIALAAFFVLRTRFGAGTRGRSGGEESSPPEIPRLSTRGKGAKSALDGPPDYLRWQVEMHETARDLKAELDSKLSALQSLVAIAARERERLEAAIARAERRQLDIPRDALAAIENLGDPAALDDPERMAEVARGLPPPHGHIPADLFERNDRRLKIAELADRGAPPAEIARELGMSVGDVELLLSLRSA
jgi:hypothetical protein